MPARRFIGAATAALVFVIAIETAQARNRLDPAPVPVAGAMIDDRFAHLRVPEAYASARAAARTRPRDLVTYAARFLATNPTGWARAWCGRFLRMIVPADPGSAFDRARNWRRYGRAVGGPVIGAIGVMPHHVGIVLGRCRGGVLMRSGNHNGSVGDGCYPARRFIAWRI